MHWAHKQKFSIKKLQFLRDVLFSPCGFDLLSLMNLPLAGYHEIGRNGTSADFTRQIKTAKGVVKLLPLLISRYHDFMGSDPVVKDDDELIEHTI